MDLENKKIFRQPNIATDWIQGMTQEEKIEFEKSWRNSTFVLDKLKLIIERSLKSLEIDQEDDYDHPQWPIKRADRNGRVKELRRILKLLP